MRGKETTGVVVTPEEQAILDWLQWQIKRRET
jgi:hypothetical protein